MSLCPVPSGAAQHDFAASVLVSATMTRLTTGDLSVRSFEAYIRDFTFVWLIPLSSWASARRSPFAQPTFLSACRFLCRAYSFQFASSAELRLAHHVFAPNCGSTHVGGARSSKSESSRSGRPPRRVRLHFGRGSGDPQPPHGALPGRATIVPQKPPEADIFTASSSPLRTVRVSRR